MSRSRGASPGQAVFLGEALYSHSDKKQEF